jgi:hypothetical protein
MTRRENVLKVFTHKMPEWIPIFGHVDAYSQPDRAGMDPELARGLAALDWGDKGIVTFCRHLGLEIMDRVGPPIRSKQTNVRFRDEWQGDVYQAWWETPYGELHQRSVRTCNSVAPVEYPLKGADDVRAMSSIFQDEQFEIDPQALARLEERRKLIGEDGIMTLSMPGTPLGDMVRRYSGVATLAYLYADSPRELGDLLAAIEENYLRRMRLAAACNADAVISYDDTSTSAISPRMFRDFEMPYIDRAAEIMHRAGKLYIHHSCGLIRNLLDLYADTAMDAVDALTIRPIGDVTVAEAKRRLGRNIVILAGFIQISVMAFDRDWVRRSVREMFEQAAPGDNFMPGLFPDPMRTMDDLELILDEARKHQKL